MTSVRDLHPLQGEAGFTWRGVNPTRVEALSDMVFAFALTLLVVSSQPPGSLAELEAQLWAFPGFAAAFAILLVIWHSHYIFFRRYALQDGWTTILNAGLLFIILFFVYPLKYLGTMFAEFVRSLMAGAPTAPFTLAEAEFSLALMSLGYAAVFGVFFALYAHALNKGDALDLTQRERELTRFAIWQQGVHVFVGVLAALGALLLPAPWSAFSGFAYALIGPLIFVGGARLAQDPKPARKPTPAMQEREL
ncbi:TMEM175 family protein [Vitreimonas flagellata]|uniref:TMEM175 family protein n=1 Tax=Vitreimonas flagellata TaxID=2560861 RepID=UPI0010754CCE|nr:TMEM175 family protein [Vitreimonas flagellata]